MKYAALGANTLTASNAPITAGQTSSFTGITGAGPTAAINIGAGTTACLGTPVALIASVSSGGDSPFTYSWSPATGLTDANIANPSATPAATQAYTVTVTDANGITDAAVTTITINSTPAPAISTSGSSTCDVAGTDVTLTSDLAPNGGIIINGIKMVFCLLQRPPRRFYWMDRLAMVIIRLPLRMA